MHSAIAFADPMRRELALPRRKTATTAEPRSLRFQSARTRDQRIGAFRLLHDRYVSSGLAFPSESGLRVMPFQLRADAQIFVAVDGQQVVGTVSVVRDEQASLPLASSFADQISQLSGKWGSLAEMTSFAIAPEHAHSTRAFAGLTSIAVHFARDRGAKCLVAAVHPRHARVYQRAMGFRAVGRVQAHEGVLGNPAALIAIATNAPAVVPPAWRGWYFDRQFSEADLAAHPLSSSDRRYFCSLAESLSDECRRSV